MKYSTEFVRKVAVEAGFPIISDSQYNGYKSAVGLKLRKHLAFLGFYFDGLLYYYTQKAPKLNHERWFMWQELQERAKEFAILQQPELYKSTEWSCFLNNSQDKPISEWVKPFNTEEPPQDFVAFYILHQDGELYSTA